MHKKPWQITEDKGALPAGCRLLSLTQYQIHNRLALLASLSPVSTLGWLHPASLSFCGEEERRPCHGRRSEGSGCAAVKRADQTMAWSEGPGRGSGDQRQTRAQSLEFTLHSNHCVIELCRLFGFNNNQPLCTTITSAQNESMNEEQGRQCWLHPAQHTKCRP